MVDACYEKIRVNHQVLSQGVLLVVGIQGGRVPGDPGHVGGGLGERGELVGGLQGTQG